MFACVHRQMFGPLHWTYQRREHRKMCEQLIGVLTGRIGKSYIAQLTREMKRGQRRVGVRKRLGCAIRSDAVTVVEQNAVVFDSDVDADFFGVDSDELEASVHAFYVRAGSIRGERNWVWNGLRM